MTPPRGPEPQPFTRHSARVILADVEDRLLLLESDGFWFTPGGGIEPGETVEQAAARELWWEREASALRGRLAEIHFGLVLTSPLQRARRTAELAGFPDAEVEPRAVEWDYGDYEGRTRAEIRREVPGWSPWTHPDMPHGETLAQLAARARGVVERVRSAGVADVLLFAHGHLLRMVAVAWIEAAWEMAWRLPLEPAHLSVLGWDRGTAVLDRWNA